MTKKKRVYRKPRSAKPSRPKKRPKKDSPSILPVGLKEALRLSGIREERIPTLLLILRALSDEQAGPACPPTAPMPADPGSREEARTVEAARAVLKEKAEWERRYEKDIATAKAAVLQSKRWGLWRLEGNILREPPRVSHVGRALYEKRAVRESSAKNYIDVYEHLANTTPPCLPPNLCLAVKIVRGMLVVSSTAATAAPKDTKSAASMLTKNMDSRRRILVERLGCAQQKHNGREICTWLTPLGRKLFRGWPQWDQ